MKTSSRPGAKTPKPETCKVEICKANLTLSLKNYQKLFITSVMSGRSASSLVEELIDTHLKSWAMPVNLAARAVSRHQSNSANSEHEVNLDVAQDAA